MTFPLLNSISKNPIKLLVGFILISLVFRLPSLFIPYLDIDEVLWGLFANAVVDGGTPYLTVMGEKPPMVYLVYSFVFFLFGKHNYFAVHILGIIWTALTSLSIFYLAKKYTHIKAAYFAAVAYIVFGTAPGFSMLATTGELLMNLPLVLSCHIFIVSYEKNNLKGIILAGMMAAMAALFRQQSLIQIGAYIGFIFIILCKEKFSKNLLSLLIKCTLALSIGCLVTVGLCLLYVFWVGVYDDFYLWVIKHNYFYIKSGFLNDNVLRNFIFRVGRVLLSTFPLWILAGMRIKNIIVSLKNQWDHALHFEILIVLYFFVSLVATLPGGRFFPHYFLQVFPPLCILAAIQLVSIMQEKLPTKGMTLIKILTLIYIVLILIRIPFIPLEMDMSHNVDYSIENKIIGDYLKNNAQADDRIFIWGWSQGIYYYSKLEPAARFISADFLTGRSPSQNNKTAGDTSANMTPGSWEMLFSDFEKHQPSYILDTSPGNHHGYGIYPIKNFPLIYNYVTQYYFLEKSIAGVDIYRLRESQ